MRRLRKNVALRRSLIAFSAVVGVFIAVNFVVFFIFSSKTYPNTKLSDLSLGNVKFSSLNTKLIGQDLLPRKITLIENGNRITTSAASLGITENNSKIIQQLKQKSWLPLANLFESHTASLSTEVNNKQLDSELTAIANKYNQSPTGASIQMVGGSFVLASDKNGYNLDISSAASQVVNGIKDNKVDIVLPISKTAASVTTASLESNIGSLKSDQNLTITYIYNGKSTTASSSDIASWYSLSGNTYVVSTNSIQSYISSVGKADGITVQNLSAAALATQNALQKLTPLSFNLTAVPNTACSSNSDSQLILVSVSQQHLWACNGADQVYDSAVVTGDEQLADTLTPVGTYHIYAKATNRTLTGHDENGSWSDFVNYWMPFLDNQYGAYGLHDATWRPANAFGNININSSQASNGCVELPLATAAWLYGWDEVGTTVKIES